MNSNRRSLTWKPLKIDRVRRREAGDGVVREDGGRTPSSRGMEEVLGSWTLYQRGRGEGLGRGYGGGDF